MHSITNQLYKSPLLQSLKEHIDSDKSLQNRLTLQSCIENPSASLLEGAFEPIHKLRRRGKLAQDPVIIMIDGISDTCDTEVTNSPNLVKFLNDNIKHAPCIIKFIVTSRSESKLDSEIWKLDNIWLDLSNKNQSSDIRQLLNDDLSHYVTLRYRNCKRISENLPIATETTESESILDRFVKHVVVLSKGSFLFLKLILNLIENGLLVLKSGSFKILPQSISEIFLLMFNLKFQTTSSYAKISPILNVVLASRSPLTLAEIYQTVCAGLLYEFPSWAEFLEQFKVFKDLIRKRHDNTHVFFHPSLKEWLSKRGRSESQKFLCDINLGHSSIALKLSRLNWPLDDKKTLQLAYHIVR